MTEYALYLESGPKRRKTMVHVLELLGCIARGATTEAALTATPESIRSFLRFLHSHGQDVDPLAPFNTHVVVHVMEGNRLGEGNPVPGFAPDFEPLSERELAVFLERLHWLRQDMLALVQPLPRSQTASKPAGKGRPLDAILEHVLESQGAYLRAGLSERVPALADALRTARDGPHALPEALDQVWAVTTERLAAMTPEERTQRMQRGQVTYTARRAIRRMLEHSWEHLVEIQERLSHATISSA